MHGEILTGKTEVTHHVNYRGDEFRVGAHVLDAQDIHVKLEKFPQAALLHPLVAEKPGYRIPADGAFEVSAFRGHHSGEGGGQLRSQRH